VRHALRARGVVLVQGPRPTNPFDIYTDRKLVYSIRDGAPDPATLERDRAAIAAMARATLESSTRRAVSPVYALLPHLEQPEWQQLLLAGDNEFGAAYREWKSRMTLAQQRNRAGDILLLAGETPVRALALAARHEAGRALMKLSQFAFALEQFEAALALAPAHLPSLQQRAICLGRMGRFEAAREAVAQLTADPVHARNAEVWALAGRVDKDEWVQRWRPAGPAVASAPAAAAAPPPPGALREAAAAEDALLAEAIVPYRKAFVIDPGHFYSGINALALSVMRAHLGGAHDPAETERLLAGLRWSVAAALEREPRDYWARATQAVLTLLCNPEHASIQRDWKAAVAVAGRDWFKLDSSRQRLEQFADVGFRPEQTALARTIVEAELARLVPPVQPRQVLLFAGHRVDAPGRPAPRFPPGKVGAAEVAVGRALDALGAGAADFGFTQGAAGGDLLFTEQCQARGVAVRWLQPLAEPDFIEASVLPSADGAAWRERYLAARQRLAEPPSAMPAELGPPPRGVDLWERGNLWLLHTALAHGPDKARFVCLWDGGGGDGPGGTRHMLEEVRRRTGRVSWIDVRNL
jgi:tetratricopeptide (TPR) repeat protein